MSIGLCESTKLFESAARFACRYQMIFIKGPCIAAAVVGIAGTLGMCLFPPALLLASLFKPKLLKTYSHSNIEMRCFTVGVFFTTSAIGMTIIGALIQLLGFASALKHKDRETVRSLYQNGSTLFLSPFSHRFTSLHTAVSQGNMEEVNEILQKEPILAFTLAPRSEEGNWTTPIHEAIRNGRIEVVRAFLQIYPELVAITDDNGSTPLHCAVVSHRLDMVKLLLKVSMKEIFAKNYWDKTPVEYAASHAASNEGTLEDLKNKRRIDSLLKTILVTDLLARAEIRDSTGRVARSWLRSPIYDPNLRGVIASFG